MLEMLKRWVMALFKVPPEPHPPAGSSESLLVFRASAGYLKYRTVAWLLSQLGWLFGIASLAGTTLLFAMAVASKVWPAPGSGKRTLVQQIAPGVIPTLVAVIVTIALLVWVTEMLVGYAVMRLDYDMRWYKVTDRSLRIREGVIVVREMTMTFANIQNISITQGPLQKAFGVADLIVESAGGGPVQPGELNLHMGAFRGVDNAEELKQLMLARLRALKDSGLGDHDDPDGHPATSTLAHTPPRSSHSIALDASPEVLAALREVRDAAREMRAAASRNE